MNDKTTYEPLKKPVDTPFKTGGGGLVGVAFVLVIVGVAIILIGLATWAQ